MAEMPIVATLTSQPETSSATLGKLFEALSKAQGAMKPAELDCENQYYKRPDGSLHRYASLASVMTAIKEPFKANGLSILQQVFSKKGHYYCRTLLGHNSGEWISTTFQLILNKNDMQGLGSAITYAKRYAVAALAGVVDSEDDDGNGAAGKYQAKTPAKPAAASKAPSKQPEKPPAKQDEAPKQIPTVNGDPANYVLKIGEEGVRGKKLIEIPEATLRKGLDYCNEQLVIKPQVKNFMLLLETQIHIKKFFETMGVKYEWKGTK